MYIQCVALDVQLHKEWKAMYNVDFVDLIKLHQLCMTYRFTVGHKIDNLRSYPIIKYITVS